MEKENIDIFGILEKVASLSDYDLFVIKDFALANFYEEEGIAEILSGDYCYDFLPTIDNVDDIKEIAAYRSYYQMYEAYADLSIGDALSSLRKDYVNYCILCKYSENELDKMYIASKEDCLEYIEKNKLNDNVSDIHIPEFLPKEVTKEENTVNLKEVSKKVKKAIINQDEVVDKVLSNIVYNQKLYFSDFPFEKARLLKKNMLIYGKTGTGKTEIIKQVVENLNFDIPYVIEDASEYTINGYKGKDVVDMLRELVISADYDVEKAEHGILVIDEIDKKLSHGEGSDIASIGVLQSLLKIIEGGEFDLSSDKMPELNGEIIDTSLISVILLGHFDGLYKEGNKKSIGFNSSPITPEHVMYKPEDFVNLGMIPEFMGRINDIVRTNDMDVDVIEKIIKNSSISPIALEKEFFKHLGVKLSFDDEFVTSLAKKSLDKQTGARGIKSSYDEMMGDLSFEILSGDLKEISFEKGKVRKRKKFNEKNSKEKYG